MWWSVLPFLFFPVDLPVLTDSWIYLGSGFCVAHFCIEPIRQHPTGRLSVVRFLVLGGTLQHCSNQSYNPWCLGQKHTDIILFVL